ncbi:MAG: cyclic nucleotide-binding domain-containing protein [Gammaproteobacteria bacterium]|nr:MAG: cyclic nucleotide-binding domain-containing protein [Gammaproteobacteria bacterium]
MSEVKEQFEEIIKQLIPISDLSASAQNDVIEAAEILEFKKKKFVFKEGKEDSYSYYILAGELELIANHHVHNTMVGGAENARFALAQLQPRQFSAKAKTPVTILRLDRGALDRLMVHEGNKQTESFDTTAEMDVSHIDEEESGDWMTRMLQSELFARLPMANIQQLFAFLEPVVFETGDTVIKQGEPGDNYYIIQEGICEVTRVPGEGKDPIKLAELVVGDSFGEEALLTDATRNATITMLSDGVLMQLNKDSFVDLIKKPSLSSVDFEQARQIVEEGGEWIDVRFAKEYKASHIETSTNIALNVIRAQIDKFNPDTHYVLCCDTGGRSSAAAFLLTQKGFHVSYLEGGFVSNPQAAQAKGDDVPSQQEKSGQAVQDKPAEEIVESEKEVVEEVDSAVKVSVLETELAKNKMELEAAEKKQKEKSEQANKKQKEANEAEKKSLEQEKIEIEQQKKLAEEDLDRSREEEIVKIKKTKKDAASRMQDEKENLEEIYSKNTEEMKKLQEMKARAEAQIRKAREQLEKQAKESRRELDEARSLKSSAEEEKKKIDREAEHARVKHAELEKSVKAKAKALLEKVKRKLAEKVAQNNEELAQAKREKAVAEAGRVAAKEEAAKIIEEYKAQFAEEKAELEALLKAERAKLEKEAQQIRDKLNEVYKAKDEAETASKLAEKEAKKLKAKQDKKIKKEGKEDKVLKKEMQRAEEKLEEAKRALDDAQHEEKITEAAKEEIDEDLLRQKEDEKKLNQQMEAELNEWKEGEIERQTQFEGKESQAEHIRRIRESAEAAREKTKKAAEDLFSDIADQISDTDHHKLR